MKEELEDLINMVIMKRTPTNSMITEATEEDHHIELMMLREEASEETEVVIEGVIEEWIDIELEETVEVAIEQEVEIEEDLKMVNISEEEGVTDTKVTDTAEAIDKTEEEDMKMTQEVIKSTQNPVVVTLTKRPLKIPVTDRLTL